ncbi:MAG: hypothetical protein ACLVL7_08190 [Anaerotruncus massiliensis (ex Togo et al. 2019)]
MLEGDVAADRALAGALLVGEVDLGVQHLHDALVGGGGAGEEDEHHREHHEGHEDLEDVVDEGDHLGGLKLPADDLPAAEPDDRDGGEVHDDIITSMLKMTTFIARRRR